jgi:hypothetical protein
MKTAPPVIRIADFPLSAESLTDLMRDVLARGKPFRFRARGLSMSPFIKDGDVLTILPLAGTVPRKGDIVAFIHPATGKVAVHRIVRAESGLFFLKGDNAPEGDGGLPLDRILGVVGRIEGTRAGLRALSRRAGAVIASLSRSGLLTTALGAARRARGRKSGRN